MARPLLACAAAAGAAGGASDAGDCKCLQWDQVYAEGRALCGEGLEWFTFAHRTDYDLTDVANGELLMGFTYYEFCTSFFKRMQNNYCVNIGLFQYGTKEWYAGTWCYVSKACQDLNGGRAVADKLTSPPTSSWWLVRKVGELLHTPRPVPRDVSWKVCRPGQDEQLRDMDPEEVLALAHKMDSVAGYVAKMAYPRLLTAPHSPTGQGHIWDDVKEAVEKGDVASMPKELQDAVANNAGIVVDLDPEGHTHMRLIKGKKVVELEGNCDASGCGAKQWPFRRGPDVGHGRPARGGDL